MEIFSEVLRLANESEKDYWPILEILTAFVRKDSTVDTQVKETPLNILPISMDIQANESKKSKVSEVIDVLLDIQAVLIVIARRKHYYNHGETNSLNLERTNLRKCDLSSAILSGAELYRANLSEANLSEANLYRANLSEAILYGAYLSGANLYRANLSEANLYGANLSEAYLCGAYLSGADLSEANLSGADLSEANLSAAKNLTFGQLSIVKTLYNAKLDEELEKQLKEKYSHLFKEPNKGDKIIANL